MKNTNLQNLIKTAFVTALFSASLLVGCGSSSGDYEGDYSSSKYYTDTSYYNSEKSYQSNLMSVDKLYSADVDKGFFEVKIPVDNKEVDYVAVISNASRGSADLKITLNDYSIYQSQRASTDNENEMVLSSGLEVGFDSRLCESLLDKMKLEQEMDNLTKDKAFISAIRMSNQQVNHSDEKVGVNYDIPILTGSSDVKVDTTNPRSCRLAQITDHCKIFVDTKDCYVDSTNYTVKTITEKHINGFAEEFEKYIYPVLRDNFGNGGEVFWNDIDQDGRLSIVISPVYNCYGGGNVAGIFDRTSFYNSNSDLRRDMIGISVHYASTGYSIDKWYMDARETIAHEMQHIVNFSAKKNSETLWINEGLSVCAEMLYRKKRAENHETTFSFYDKIMIDQDFIGNDGRLAHAFMKSVCIVSMHEFPQSAMADPSMFAHYALKGLFFFYLYEQYGSSYIRDLCQSSIIGESKFTSLNKKDDRSLGQMSVDFYIALTNERTRCFKGDNFLQALSSEHKFVNNLNLDYHNYYGTSAKLTEDVFFDRKYFEGLALYYPRDGIKMMNIPGNNSVLCFLIRQSKDFAGRYEDFNLTFSSSSNADFIVNMIRVTP